MRPAKFLLCAILSLANLALAAQKPEFGPVPGWVQPAVLPASADRDDAPVKLILMDWQFKLGTSGAEGYFESAMRIQTPQGLQSLSTLTLPWNPSTDVLTVHALQIIRGDQKVDMLAGGRTFEVLRRENSLEYAALDGVLTAAIQPEGLQVGDIIDIVYSIKRSDPALLGISEWIAMGWPSVPISSVRLRGVWSNTDKVQWKASDSLAGIQQTRHGDTTEVNLAMANVSPLVLPKGAPARYRLGRYIEFSNLKSWSQVADHMAPLYAHASSLSPQSTLNAEVARIRRSSTDRRLQAIAALALVQDQVRYVFLGMNDGALVPADADVTWSRRFGDCKAKTALLIALLRALGIDAQPVAVNTLDGESVKSGLPMVAAFNHVLVRANIDGNTYWLDGTGSGDRQVDELLMPPYRWGLPLVPKGDLVAIMPTPAAVPVTDTSIQIDATAGIPGTATVHAATAFRGQFAAAMRFTLGSLDAKARERALREFWSKVLDSVTIDKVESRFDEKDAKEYFTMEGSRSLAWVNGREQLEGIDFNYRSDFQRPEDERSDAPFAVTFPSYSRITETVKLPQADSGFW
ncbi:MAG: DUF3857 domain-containing protein, partial [Steroidobacteraceae bacterium]